MEPETVDTRGDSGAPEPAVTWINTEALHAFLEEWAGPTVRETLEEAERSEDPKLRPYHPDVVDDEILTQTLLIGLSDKVLTGRAAGPSDGSPPAQHKSENIIRFALACHRARLDDGETASPDLTSVAVFRAAMVAGAQELAVIGLRARSVLAEEKFYDMVGPYSQASMFLDVVEYAAYHRLAAVFVTARAARPGTVAVFWLIRLSINGGSPETLRMCLDQVGAPTDDGNFLANLQKPGHFKISSVYSEIGTVGDPVAVLNLLTKYAGTPPPDVLDILIKRAQSAVMVRRLIHLRGQPPTDACYYAKNTSVLRVLVEAGADPDYISPYGNRALNQAAITNKLALVRDLVDVHGCDVNGTANRRTALYDALRRGRPDIVRFLLAAGASPNIPDEYGDFILVSARPSLHIRPADLAEGIAVVVASGTLSPEHAEAFRRARTMNESTIEKLSKKGCFRVLDEPGRDNGPVHTTDGRVVGGSCPGLEC